MTATKSSSIMSLSRRFLRYPLEQWPGLVAVLSSTLLASGLEVLKPWPLKIVVDQVLKDEPVPNHLSPWFQLLPGFKTADGLLVWCLAATAILFFLVSAVGLARSCANIAFGQRLNYALAADLFSRLQQLSLRFHSSKSIGDSMRRVTSDCTCIATIVDALLPVLAATFSLALMF